MISINMMSSADKVKGQGVLSAHDEQVGLMKQIDEFNIEENKLDICDITHFHTVNLEYNLWLPFLKRKSTTVAYVHFVPQTLEGSLHLFKPFKYVFYRYLIKFYNSMDRLVVVNPYFIDVLNSYGINKEKIKYIPNYVSSENFYPKTAEEKDEIRKKYNIAKDKFVVLSVGQLQKRKGVIEFIELAKTMPDIEFVWAGGAVFGKMTEGYDEIKEIINNDLPSNVHFLGLVAREEMNNIYNLANVMFLPSYEELFPMCILEAMCVNIPVLTRDLDIYNGILFDFYASGKDNDEFRQIIQKLHEDKSFYDTMIQKSKEGNIFYGKENISNMWHEFYKECVKYKKGIDGR